MLRNIDRQKVRLLKEIKDNKIPKEARLNHPAWLIERWKSRYGQDLLEEICRANISPANIYLRINTLKVSVNDFRKLLAENDISTYQGQFMEEALCLDGYTGSLENLSGYNEGFFSVQDEIAQLLCYLFAPFPNGMYLDACAGLGGKTAVLRQVINEKSKIVAVEPNDHRLELLKENINRLGLTMVDVFAGTLDDFAKQAKDKFEAILVDAPCSGLGVTGRHPDIRWVRKEEDLLRYQKNQIDLLTTAASLVQPKGILVYATCSMEPEENEQVVMQFLEDNKLFRLEDAKSVLASNAHELLDDKGFLRTLPGKQTTDGFFAARLVRD